MSSKERPHRKDEDFDRCQSTTGNPPMKRKSGGNHPRKRRSPSLSPDRGRKRKRLSVSEKEHKRRKHRRSKKYKVHKKKQPKKAKPLSLAETKIAKDPPLADKPEDAPTKPQRHKAEEKPEKDENCYDVSDNDSELNLSKPMHRIIDYIDDKRELCHQTFKTLRGRKLHSMIPEILRGYSLTDLRDMCHSELNGMSKKRVLRILNGDEPEGISSSSSSSTGDHVTSDSNSSTASDSDVSHSSSSSSASSTSSSTASKYRARREHHKSRAKGKKSSKKHAREKEKLSSTPEAVVDSTCKIEEPNIDESKLTEKDAANTDEPGAGKGEPEKEVFEDQDVLVVSATDLNQDLDQELTHRDPAPDEGESALPADRSAAQMDRARRKEIEILELEMRARAIRSMIKAQEAKDPRLRLKKM